MNNNIFTNLTEKSKDNLHVINTIKNVFGHEFFNNKDVIKAYEELSEIYTQINNNDIKNIIIFDPNDLDRHNLTNIFTLDDIKNKNPESITFQEFQKLNTWAKISLDINDLHFMTNYFYDNKMPNVNDLINKIHKRLKVLLTYGARNNNTRYHNLIKAQGGNVFNIYFVLYPVGRNVYKRIKNYDNIESELNELSSKGYFNCSSGYTMFYVTDKRYDGKMLITRIPEILGLLTHEIGHLLGWDYETFIERDNIYTTTGIDINKINKLSKSDLKILKKLPLAHNDCEFAEAFVNMNTTILHSMCNTLELDKSNYDLFKEFMNIEILYSIYHSAKILYFIGFESFDQFFNNNSNKLYYQNALLFEYSIVRSFLLINLDELIKYQDMRKFVVNDNQMNDSRTERYINKRDELIKYILNLMTGTDLNEKQKRIRSEYEIIFDEFINIIKNDKNNTMNMEYFCIDINKNAQSAGSHNKNNKYFEKYLKYKKRYLKMKYL